ncbi:Serine/threonine protein kinase [Handroanthus impetiginosus]|uniref:non-specific serine/threonine protein kinase n=1 Tax=Handroanthus impetiginosus TaxID=429701 RepID=A0A2G9G3G4_9LAMI|nr:Serine/threonine protein kinase [Handroanthus impetiginosus]
MPLPPTDKTLQGKAKSLSPNEITSVAAALPPMDRNMLSVSTRQLTMASSNVPNVTSPLGKQINSEMINAGKKDVRKTTMRKLLRLWPWDALRNTTKPAKKESVNFSKSAPISRRTSNMTLRASTVSKKSIAGSGELLPTPNLRIFHFSELKAATRNFSNDTVLGGGGFGTVYRGWLKEESGGKQGSGSVVAIKMLNREGIQGFAEWKAEVNFLGRLSHPNLVKLLGYSWSDIELLLVYEFMQNGSLENHLFYGGSAIQPIPWDIRLKILIGAARGLAFLHTSGIGIIHRDFKTSNILLDGSYHAKISDFGLAKLGPTDGNSHVSTQVIGTYGYAAPEYVATGHLTAKSDVYSFGVVLVEMLTGLRALDKTRPARQQNLVGWVKPYLPKTNTLKEVMDSRLEGRYPNKCALQIAQLALNCLGEIPKKRPSMQEVVETLERIDSPVENGRQPRVHFS